MIKQGGDHKKTPQKTSFQFLGGSPQLTPPSPLPLPSEFFTDEENSGNSYGYLDIIITLLTVPVLFLFNFFNLILDAPRTVHLIDIFPPNIIGLIFPNSANTRKIVLKTPAFFTSVIPQQSFRQKQSMILVHQNMRITK
jgi:hypothetical protein